MRKKNTKSRKLGSIRNGIEEHNILCIGRTIEMNMINRLQKWSCHMQEKQLKTIRQGIQVETYKEEG